MVVCTLSVGLEPGDNYCCSVAETARLRAIASRRRQRQFLAGRSLLRQQLLALYGEEAADWTISCVAGQAPRIAGRPDIHLSLSHAQELVACAIGSAPLGVDVEVLAPRSQLPELAELGLGAEIAASLQTLPEADRLTAFYQHWTLHEARFKWLQEYGSLAQSASRSWLFPELNAMLSVACQGQRAISCHWPRHVLALDLPPPAPFSSLRWRIPPI